MHKFSGVCLSLPPLTNGMISYSDPTLGVGSVATHSCNTDYTLSGESTRTCQSDGTWDGSVPNCLCKSVLVSHRIFNLPIRWPYGYINWSLLAVCLSLPPLANGMISYSDPPQGVGSVATHSCDTSYTLNGGSTRTCQSDGTWSGSAPNCLRKSVLVSR